MLTMQTCLKIKSLSLWLVCSVANKTVEQQLEDQFDVLAFSTTISNANNASMDNSYKLTLEIVLVFKFTSGIK